MTIFMAGLGMVMLLSNGQIARLLGWLREKTGKGGSGGDSGAGGAGGSGAGNGSAPVMTAPGGSANATPRTRQLPNQFTFPGTRLNPDGSIFTG